VLRRAVAFGARKGGDEVENRFLLGREVRGHELSLGVSFA
jgi:hypothetical protein